MDAETLKSAFPIVGGVLALAGGVLTFINGRLKDAESAEAKQAVVSHMWFWLALALSGASFLALIVFRSYATCALLFTLGFAIQAWVFLDSKRPLGRPEVLVTGLLCAMFVGMLVFLAAFSMLERLVDLQLSTIAVQKEIANKLPKAPQ